VKVHFTLIITKEGISQAAEEAGHPQEWFPNKEIPRLVYRAFEFSIKPRGFTGYCIEVVDVATCGDGTIMEGLLLHLEIVSVVWFEAIWRRLSTIDFRSGPSDTWSKLFSPYIQDWLKKGAIVSTRQRQALTIYTVDR
jgi:hypothetical protein